MSDYEIPYWKKYTSICIPFARKNEGRYGKKGVQMRKEMGYEEK